MPGNDLSQPASSTDPSSRSAIMTVSTESAITSRDTSEKCMPSWPIEMPSDTEIVPNSSGYPPAACTPSFADFANRSSERLQGVISFHELATPIWGLTQSSSPIPTARSIPRDAVASRPSVTARLRGLISGSRVVVMTAKHYVKRRSIRRTAARGGVAITRPLASSNCTDAEISRSLVASLLGGGDGFVTGKLANPWHQGHAEPTLAVVMQAPRAPHRATR